MAPSALLDRPRPAAPTPGPRRPRSDGSDAPRRSARPAGPARGRSPVRRRPVRRWAPPAARTRPLGASAARARSATRAATSRSAPRVALTLRGQVVVVLVVTVLAVTASLLARAADGTGGAGAAPVPPGASSSVVVAPGQSLWAVATDVAPDADAAATVRLLAEANGLTPAAPLHPGQRLVVPSTIHDEP